MPKLQEKPSALKREHPALQKLKILSFFLFFGVIFALLDPDPDPQYVSGSGSSSSNSCGSGSGYGSGSETLWNLMTYKLQWEHQALQFKPQLFPPFIWPHLGPSTSGSGYIIPKSSPDSDLKHWYLPYTWFRNIIYNVIKTLVDRGKLLREFK